MKQSDYKTRKLEARRIQDMRDRTSAFLGSSAWQGVGSIISILSFVLTVVLTVYVFDWTRKQTLSTITLSRLHKSPGEDNEDITLVFTNTGPSLASQWTLEIIHPKSTYNMDVWYNRCIPIDSDAKDGGEVVEEGSIVDLDSGEKYYRYTIFRTDVGRSVKLDCSMIENMDELSIRVYGPNMEIYTWKTKKNVIN